MFESHNVEQVNDELQTLNFHMVQMSNGEKQSKWIVDLSVDVDGNQSVQFRIDTGAECSVQ